MIEFGGTRKRKLASSIINTVKYDLSHQHIYAHIYFLAVTVPIYKQVDRLLWRI